MKLNEIEKDALKLVLACDKLRETYHAEGVKVYLKDTNNFTIKVIADEHVVRTIRVGKDNNFDLKKKEDVQNG